MSKTEVLSLGDKKHYWRILESPLFRGRVGRGVAGFTK